MTSEQHNKYVAYAFLGYAGFQMLMLALSVLIMSFFFGSSPGLPAGFVAAMLAMMLIFYLIFTAPSAIAAWAILKRKEWARIAAIVAAVISAMSAPVGTAATVYALWFFLGDRWQAVYGSEPKRPEYTVRGLEGSEPEPMVDDFRQREEWMKQPPDWR